MQYTYRKIRLIEGNAKCRHLKKMACKGTCDRCFSVWGTESLPILTHQYTIYFSHREGGGWTREKVRGAAVQKAGSKISTWLTVSPVYKHWKTPAAKSLYKSICLDADILLWCPMSTQLINPWLHIHIRTYFRTIIYDLLKCPYNKCIIQILKIAAVPIISWTMNNQSKRLERYMFCISINRF